MPNLYQSYNQTNLYFLIPSLADLCAYRSKLHIEAQRDMVDTTGYTGKLEEIETEIIKQLNEMVKVNDKLKDRLYYC